jgi:serine/threonine protein kinase
VPAESKAIPEREQLLDELVTAYLRAVTAGHTPDRRQLLTRHPDLAAELAEFFADQDDVQRWAAPLRMVAALQAEGALGDFRIIREIGRGGMGVVYEALQISLGRRVALKVLPFAAALDSKQLQRFKNEAQAAAGLQHTNIVPVYFVGCERGVHFYAMQFVEGQTLAALIRDLRQLEGLDSEDRKEPRPLGSGAEGLVNELVSGRWALTKSPERDPQATAGYASGPSSLPPFVPAYQPGVGLSPGPVAETATPPVGALSTERSTNRPAFFQTVAKLGIQAAEALEHAHSLGVIHRDIKPGNLMVDGEPGASATGVRLWIADFGLAHCQGGAELTMSGDLLGTLRYMSPEQALAKRIIVDHRTDIYSLGATLYELLTLEPAFNGKDRQEVLRQIAFEDPKPPRRLKRSIPTELETIVLKAMEKNPAERYATAQEFADDLRRFLKGEPIRAKPVGLVKRTIKWARRRPIVVALLVVSGLALLALAGAGVGMFYNSRLQAALDQSLEQKGIAEAQKQIAHQERTEADKQRGLARRFLYFSRIGLAYQAWQDARITRMQELLDKLRPQDGDEDLRSFEWHYLKRLLGHHSLLTLKGHASAVDCVAFSKDGKRLASASSDQTAKIWDASTGREILTIKCNAGTVATVALSPDGKRLATGTGDFRNPKKGELKIWDATTGHELLALQGSYRTDLQRHL